MELWSPGDGARRRRLTCISLWQILLLELPYLSANPEVFWILIPGLQERLERQLWGTALTGEGKVAEAPPVSWKWTRRSRRAGTLHCGALPSRSEGPSQGTSVSPQEKVLRWGCRVQPAGLSLQLMNG